MAPRGIGPLSVVSVFNRLPSLVIHAGRFDIPRPMFLFARPCVKLTPSSHFLFEAFAASSAACLTASTSSLMMEETIVFASCSARDDCSTLPLTVVASVTGTSSAHGVGPCDAVIHAGNVNPLPRPRGGASTLAFSSLSAPDCFDRAFSFSSCFQRSKATLSSSMAASAPAFLCFSSSSLRFLASRHSLASSSSLGSSSRALFKMCSPWSSSSSQASSASMRVLLRIFSFFPFSASLRRFRMSLRCSRFRHLDTTSNSPK
mmetsp:Transcript_12973/g.38113  ORF Transcript_12973/g.38113 Transcript_12973/m.38113 type:complete len:260 (+) Transcript_12973:563-1342(+)